ncbi:MAG: molybdopterin-dependent oxidoreductase [SAR324 cluster bacterium]|nr:molybdopterin-dependent oxidoreductase [SAR324 cluster bacterium]
MTTETRKTICPLDCPDACGMIATLENGIITKVTGDPDHPITQGFLCHKVQTYHHRIQSADRVLHPQHRVGKKGEGQFGQISWDDAWQILTEQLTNIKKKYGGEALLPYSYAGNMGMINRPAGYPFFHKYGASQLLQTICSAAAKEGWSLHYGAKPGSPPEKAADADLIIAWGISAKVTNIHFMPFVQKAKRRGAKLIVIDPYLNSTAKSADVYYPVTPGGDTALALGMLKHCMENGLIDQNFIGQYTDGFEEFADYLESKTLEEFATISGLTAAQIQELATLIGQTKKTFIRIGIGLTRNTQGAMSVRAITCFSAAMGLFNGIEGRGALLQSGAFSGDTHLLSYPSLMEAPTRAVNMVQLGHALTELSPPVKGLFVYNSNPLSIAPDTTRVKAGLEREDLFTVVHEQFLTPTARYADLLLPATTSFENHDLYTGYGHFYMGRVDPVIPPQGEAVSNFDLFQTLAQKMGYTDAPFLQTIDDRIESYAASIKEIPEKQKKEGLVSGEIIRSDIINHGGDFSQFGQYRFNFSVKSRDPNIPRIPCILPRHEFDDPNLKSRYPFQLITPPMKDMLNSTFGERYCNEAGTLMIHPLDAEAHSIQEGMLIEVFNGRGRNIRKAAISTNTQPGLLILEGIYWENESSQMTSVNELTSQQTTDLGGGGTFHEARVNIRKVLAKEDIL